MTTGLPSLEDMCERREYNPERIYPPSYSDLISSFPCGVMLSEQCGSYQGDTLLLLCLGKQYGFLTFGWGSCSGCDALESCHTVAEVNELRDDLWNRVWWGSPSDLLKYLDEKDIGVEWWGSEGREAFAKIYNTLADIVGVPHRDADSFAERDE